jgi:hypothetical protein
MKLFKVKAEQVIFHTINILANDENEATSRANELIQNRKAFSTSQEIQITDISASDPRLEAA